MQQPSTSPAAMVIRMDKLRFLAEELALAAELCRHASHSDMARMMSRHIAVRIADFIGHARQLRNKLPPSTAKNDIKCMLDALDSEFQNYLAPARHKLSAHVQDMDFAERLDMWAAIDAAKISYFAEGARELWDSVAETGTQRYEPFWTPTVLADPSVALVLADLSKPADAQVTIGTDPLADARANTAALLNLTPIHQRAGQIALLRRWLRVQADLLERFCPGSPVARMLKARLLSDIVNFQDCLITRSVAQGAPQKLKGLDQLVTEAGEDATAIRAFVASSREEATIDPLRSIRNRICSHLNDDASVPLAALLDELDSFDLPLAWSHLVDLEATFVRTCRDVFFLSVHLTDGMLIRGVLAKPVSPTPFDSLRPDAIALPPPRPTYTQEEMKERLKGWTTGDERSIDEALWYFRDAFSQAPIVETRRRTEDLGAGKRFHQLGIRSSHLLLLEELARCEELEADRLLLLAASCPGYPAELTEVLLDYYATSEKAVSPALLEALGNLAPWWMENARVLVQNAIRQSAGPERLLARSTLLRIYLREEGPKRINRHPGPAVWPKVKVMTTGGGDRDERLIAGVVLAGTFLARPVGSYIKQFETEYREIADEALNAACDILAGTIDEKGQLNLRRLLHRGELAQATQLIATSGPPGHAASTKGALLEALALGLITAGHSGDERLAIAECLVLLGCRLGSGLIEATRR